MVSLQSVNVAIRVNPLYRTAARHIQTFVLLIAEKGNWVSACEAPRGMNLKHIESIIDELSRMVQRSIALSGLMAPSWSD